MNHERHELENSAEANSLHVKVLSDDSEDRKGWQKPTRPPTGEGVPQGLPPKPGSTPPAAPAEGPSESGS